MRVMGWRWGDEGGDEGEDSGDGVEMRIGILCMMTVGIANITGWK